MDEAEMLTLKAGTPRRPAREELRLWKAVLPSFPADTRGADVTHVAALGVVSPRLFSATPRVSAPGSESLIVLIN